MPKYKKIIILKLLPEKSYYYKIERGDEAIQYYGYIHRDWDPEDWKDAKSGDEFFLIQYKDNSSGIIMHGTLHSDAKHYGPCPGTKRGIYGTYLIPDQHIDEEKYRLLSTDALQTAIPEFNWAPGPSGRRLTSSYTRKLRCMWKLYILMNSSFKENRDSR